MSSPPPPLPPRSNRSLHNFDLPSDLKWSSKNQSTNNATRGRHSLASSSSSLSKQYSVTAYEATSYQPTLQNSYMLDWLHENLSKPTSGSSSGSSSSNPNFNTINNFASNLSSGPSSFSNFASSFPSGPFSFSNSTSYLPSGLSSLQSRNSSDYSLQSSSSPMQFKILPSSSATKETYFSPLLNVFVYGSSMQGTYLTSSVNFEDQFGSEKMVESFKNSLLVSDKKKKGEQEKYKKQINKQEKPLKMYENSNKKKHQGGKDNQKGKQVPKKDSKVNKPIILPEDKFDDLNANLWSFHPRKFNQQPQTLNLVKNVGSSFTNQGKHTEENIDKQFKAVAKSKQKSGNKNKGKKHDNQKNKKGKEKKPKQEQEPEIKLPEFSLQLTPEEIAEDLFAMMWKHTN